METRSTRPPWFALGLALLACLALVAMRFCEPVGDGDLFWQMAYGSYMLQHHTLIPDHTVYSWTPADNPYLYCSWFAEIVLYGLHCLGGLPLLFALRYAVVLGSGLLVLRFARKLGWHVRLEAWLLTCWMIASTYVGSILKPEMFSLGFMTLFAYLLFSFRLADSRALPTRRYVVAAVLTMVLWANTHGVFVFGLVGLGALVAGEVVNWLLSPRYGLSPAGRKQLGWLVLGCGLAAFVTPYHVAYVQQLANEFLSLVMKTQSSGDAAAYNSLAAHRSIWEVRNFHFHEYLMWGLFAGSALCGWLALYARESDEEPVWRNRVDFVFLALNVALLPFFCVYLRSTFYWPIFFAFSLLYLVHLLQRRLDGSEAEPGPPARSFDAPFTWMMAAGLLVFTLKFNDLSLWLNWLSDSQAALLTFGSVLLLALAVWAHQWIRAGRASRATCLQPRGWVAALMLCLQLLLCGRCCVESVLDPYASSFFGFGITYWNPVDETEFLKKFHPGLSTIINDYDSGGYLIWAGGGVKVMIDPRSFPYRKFWADYIAYEQGRGGLDFLQTLPKPLPTVSLVSVKNRALCNSFLQSSEWVPGWLGTAYVVFVPKGFKYPDEAARFMPQRFATVRNSIKVLQLFQFAMDAQLYEQGWQILEQTTAYLNTTAQGRDILANLTAHRACVEAVQANKLEDAIAQGEACWRMGYFCDVRLLLGLYKFKLTALARAKIAATDPRYAEVLNRYMLLQRGAAFPSS